MRRLSDQELINAYLDKQDNDYVGVLYKRYMGLVYGVCYKYLNSHQDAEDAAVEIFLLIMEKLKTNKITYFKSWLYIVSKNYLISIIRKKKGNRTDFFEEIQEEFMESPDDFRLNIEELKKTENSESLLKLGLESLKEAQQVCLEQFYLQSKSYVQVAEVTGFDVRQVKSHIQNGKRNLKAFLESKGYGHE